MDYALKNGKIVESVNEHKLRNRRNRINRHAWGVDIHTHIAGAKSTLARMVRPEEPRQTPVSKTLLTR